MILFARLRPPKPPTIQALRRSARRWRFVARLSGPCFWSFHKRCLCYGCKRPLLCCAFPRCSSTALLSGLILSCCSPFVLIADGAAVGHQRFEVHAVIADDIPAIVAVHQGHEADLDATFPDEEMVFIGGPDRFHDRGFISGAFQRVVHAVIDRYLASLVQRRFDEGANDGFLDSDSFFNFWVQRHS